MPAPLFEVDAVPVSFYILGGKLRISAIANPLLVLKVGDKLTEVFAGRHAYYLLELLLEIGAAAEAAVLGHVVIAPVRMLLQHLLGFLYAQIGEPCGEDLPFCGLQPC